MVQALPAKLGRKEYYLPRPMARMALLCGGLWYLGLGLSTAVVGRASLRTLGVSLALAGLYCLAGAVRPGRARALLPLLIQLMVVPLVWLVRSGGAGLAEDESAALVAIAIPSLVLMVIAFPRNTRPAEARRPRADCFWFGLPVLSGFAFALHARGGWSEWMCLFVATLGVWAWPFLASRGRFLR